MRRGFLSPLWGRNIPIYWSPSATLSSARSPQGPLPQRGLWDARRVFPQWQNGCALLASFGKNKKIDTQKHHGHTHTHTHTHTHRHTHTPHAPAIICERRATATTAATTTTTDCGMAGWSLRLVRLRGFCPEALESVRPPSSFQAETSCAALFALASDLHSAAQLQASVAAISYRGIGPLVLPSSEVVAQRSTTSTSPGVASETGQEPTLILSS